MQDSMFVSIISDGYEFETACTNTLGAFPSDHLFIDDENISPPSEKKVKTTTTATSSSRKKTTKSKTETKFSSTSTNNKKRLSLHQLW